MSPLIEETETEGSKVTLFGRHHTQKDWENNKEKIKRGIENSDAFAWEAVGLQNSMEKGNNYYSLNELENRYGKNNFLTEINRHALENHDKLYGPDSKYNSNSFSYVFEPQVGILSAGIFAIYRLTTELFDIARVLETDNPEPEEIDKTRRNLITGSGIAISISITDVIGNLLYSFNISDTTDGLTYWTSTSYSDMREATTAEGLKRLAKLEGDVFYLGGSSHMKSIKAYLENDDIRKRKLSYWSLFPYDSDEQMAVYRNNSENWLLDHVVELV